MTHLARVEDILKEWEGWWLIHSKKTVLIDWWKIWDLEGSRDRSGRNESKVCQWKEWNGWRKPHLKKQEQRLNSLRKDLTSHFKRHLQEEDSRMRLWDLKALRVHLKEWWDSRVKIQDGRSRLYLKSEKDQAQIKINPESEWSQKVKKNKKIAELGSKANLIIVKHLLIPLK